MLYGLLAPISLRLGGIFLSLLNFLHELLESFVQHLSSDLAALNSYGNNLGIYFILHRDLLSENCRSYVQQLRRHTPKIDNGHP